MIPNRRIQARPSGTPSGTVSTLRPSAPRGMVIVSHGRISSLMPSDDTTRSQTSSDGAATSEACPTTRTVIGSERRRLDRRSGVLVRVDVVGVREGDRDVVEALEQAPAGVVVDREGVLDRVGSLTRLHRA